MKDKDLVTEGSEKEGYFRKGPCDRDEGHPHEESRVVDDDCHHEGVDSEKEACATEKDPLAKLRDAFDELNERLEAVVLERDEWKSRAEDNWNSYLRARADMENYKKRTERDIHLRISRGKSGLFVALLEVLDNFDRLLSVGEQSLKSDEGAAVAPFVDGAALIKRQLLAVLAKEGVEPLDDPVGQIFDPNYHEALFAQEGGGEHGTIVEEIQKGYAYQAEVLRPSKVKVIK